MGEFSLLYMLSKRSNLELTEQVRKQLENLCFESSKRLLYIEGAFIKNNIINSMSYNVSRAMTILCLGKAPNNLGRLLCDVYTTLTQVPDDEISIEHIYFAYFYQLSGGKIEVDFWEKALSNTIALFSSKGLTKKLVYQLTHFLFFCTDFGLQSLSCLKEDTYIHRVNELLWTSCNHFVKNKEYDLLIEVLLSIECLKKTDCTKNIIDHFKSWQSVFKESQSGQGYFLPEATDIDLGQFSLKTNSYQILYPIFHTTIVAVLLGLKLD